MTTQVFKALQNNGMIVYSHNGKIVRNSKKDYKYALLFMAKKCMGAHGDDEDFRVVGFGNNPHTLRTSWQRIFSYGVLQVVAII